MHIKPNDLTNNVFFEGEGQERNGVAALLLEADSDAMPHFKQTMFPLVNFASQPPRGSIHFVRAQRVPTDGVGCRMANLQPTSF